MSPTLKDHRSDGIIQNHKRIWKKKNALKDKAQTAKSSQRGSLWHHAPGGRKSPPHGHARCCASVKAALAPDGPEAVSETVSARQAKRRGNAKLAWRGGGGAGEPRRGGPRWPGARRGPASPGTAGRGGGGARFEPSVLYLHGKVNVGQTINTRTGPERETERRRRGGATEKRPRLRSRRRPGEAASAGSSSSQGVTRAGRRGHREGGPADPATEPRVSETPERPDGPRPPFVCEVLTGGGEGARHTRKRRRHFKRNDWNDRNSAIF